jgi:hypothetical protein
MEVVWTFLILIIFAVILLVDLPNLMNLPGKNKNIAICLTILMVGFILSVVQIFHLFPPL